MTAENVDNLIRKVNALVVQDTGGVSLAPPEISQYLRDRLEPLADNLDVPARLAPTVPAALGRGATFDPRADIRADLTELVAQCANSLEPPGDLPEPKAAGVVNQVNRLAIAASSAYAALATPRLAPQLFPDGRADDLGPFPPPRLEDDAAAARAMAVAISARTGIGEEAALTKLVADGHGTAAPAAAELLLKLDPEYERLPADARNEVIEPVVRGIESGFADRGVEEAAFRAQTVELESRRADVSGGAGVIDKASDLATRKVAEAHVNLQWAAVTQLQELSGTVAQHLVSRVEHHAGRPIDLSDDAAKVPATATAAAAEMMVRTSTIPKESRYAATGATATMLAEGFDELPARVAEWRADGSNLQRQAEMFGNTLGDRTVAAVREFERQPPVPTDLERLQAFAIDPAIAPARNISSEESRRTDAANHPKLPGSDGLRL